MYKKCVLLVLLLVIILNSYLESAPGWEKPILVSLNQHLNKHPDVYQDDNITIIAWTAYKNNIPSIYYNYKSYDI